MAERPLKRPPALQKPPGYRDPMAPATKQGPTPAPRKPALPPSFQPRRKRTSCCRTCCCCFCIFILLLILLLIVAGAVFYLWFNPKLPVFHLLSFKLNNFDVTTKPDGTYLSAATLARVELRNPNSKLTYHYGKTEVELTLGRDEGIQLGSTKIPGFKQGKKNTTSLKVETRVNNQLVTDGNASKLQSQFKNKDLVVNVDVKTSVGLGVGGIKIGMLGVRVVCEDITLKQFDRGEMPECYINTLRWINIH